MEEGFHRGLQIHSSHRLGDPVGRSRHPKYARPVSRFLRYLYRSHRGRKIRPRAHPVPELVQVVLQLLLELLERLPVDSLSSVVGLDPTIRLPDHLLRDRKWFRSWLGRRFLLPWQLPAAQAWMACSLRSTRITGRPHYCGTVRHCMPRYHTLLLAVCSAWRPPSCVRLSHRLPRARCRGRSFPRSTLAPEPGSCRLYAGCRLDSKQVPPRLVPSRSAFSVSASLVSLSTRLQRFALARLPGSHLALSWSAFSATFTTPTMSAGAACGGLEPPPARRFRGAHPHRQRSIASRYLIYIGYPPHSWHNRTLDTEMDVEIQSSGCV
jgi:hypothetical protein